MARSTTLTKNETSSQSVQVGAFAGLDYHKKFTVVTIGDAQGNVLTTERVANNKESMRRFFARYPGIACAIESCRGYEWLLDFLKEQLHLQVDLVNTYQAKLITQSRCKTDKLDSKAIMQLLAKDYLPTCYQPSPEERRIRERLRWRAHIVRYATRMKVRIHSLVDKENLGVAGLDLFSAQGRDYLKHVPLSAARRQLLEEHLQMLEYFEVLVKAADAWVHDLLKATPPAQLLTSIPGIGELTALLLFCEIGDVTRFKTASHVPAYFGLVPRIHSSAECLHYGPLTKQGSRHVRWMLIQCAWQAIRTSPSLREHFITVSRRCGRNSAIVSVARKLVKVAYRVLRDNKPFNAELLGKEETA
jgi:transposase